MGLGKVFESLREGKAKVSKGEFFASIEKMVKDDIRIHEPLDYWSKVRSSSLPYFCAREEMIKHYIGWPWGSYESWQKQWVMDRGTGMHHVYQNLILPKMGNLDGAWICLDCGALSDGECETVKAIPRPEECLTCGGHRFIYEEIVMDDEVLLLTGHADGLWLAEKALWEFKTCGMGTYRKVINSGPLEAHRVQAGAYLSMLKRKGFDVDNVRFLYIPMEDVCGVSIPLPGVREPFYEVDPTTKAIMCQLQEKDVMPSMSAALERVMLFRMMLKSNESQDVPLLPNKHESCTTKSNGGQWKWGCDLCSECMAMGKRYDESKVEWLMEDGTIDGRIAPESVMLGGGELSLVGAQVVDPHGLIGDPESTYRIVEGVPKDE
jgi:hypothetical protein